jgi:hypothetical protein
MPCAHFALQRVTESVRLLVFRAQNPGIPTFCHRLQAKVPRSHAKDDRTRHRRRRLVWLTLSAAKQAMTQTRSPPRPPPGQVARPVAGRPDRGRPGQTGGRRPNHNRRGNPKAAIEFTLSSPEQQRLKFTGEALMQKWLTRQIFVRPRSWPERRPLRHSLHARRHLHFAMSDRTSARIAVPGSKPRNTSVLSPIPSETTAHSCKG